MPDFKDYLLWRLLTESHTKHSGCLKRLESTYLAFRDKAAGLTSLIAKSVPTLTMHDISHLDGLWQTASLLIDEDYPINPMEIFVFGCAALLHDSALSFEAFGGLDTIRATTEWKDSYSLALKIDPSRKKSDLEKDADFAAIRQLHAEQAAKLIGNSWPTGDGSGKLFLIEDDGLRNHYGPMIGKVASSHHWSMERVSSELDAQFNPIPGFPAEWVVHPAKVAALLRCADALHIDQNRAPDFLHALIKKGGVSALHWQAQNWLAQPTMDLSDNTNQTIAFTSTRDFDEKHSEAWWIAYDA
ncbi:MAG: ATP-binding protein, partial [Beijerinckiaceae bacterium]